MRTLKNLVKSVLSISLLFFSTFLLGTSITSMEITPIENEKTFLLSVETSGKGSIDVSIEDKKGNLQIEDHFESMNSFSKRINLEHVKDGNYSLIIEDEFFRNVRELSIQNGKLTVDKANVEIFKKAQMRWDNNSKKLNVSWLMNDIYKSKLTILDEDSKEIFRYKFPEQLVVNKRFNLKDLGTGTYSVVIKNQNASYTKSFYIE